jgi:hypothetical protein
LGAGVLLFAGFCTAEVLVSGVDRTSQEGADRTQTEAVLASDAGQVEIISMSGSVEVKRTGSSDYLAAEEGMLLSAGDTVKAGPGSSAELGFDESDRNIVRLEENTTSVVLLKDSEKIELLQGEVFSMIRELPPGSSFEVRTPTAVAGARGTEWVTRYSGEETDVEAYDDVPFVKSIDKSGQVGQEVRVASGQMTRVARYGRPVSMGVIPQARQERWKNARRDIGQKIQAVRERRGRPDRSLLPRREGKPGEQRNTGKIDKNGPRANHEQKPDHRFSGEPEHMAPRDKKKDIPEAAHPRIGPGERGVDAQKVHKAPEDRAVFHAQKKAAEKSDRFHSEQGPVQRLRRSEGPGVHQAAPGNAKRASAPRNLKR